MAGKKNVNDWDEIQCISTYMEVGSPYTVKGVFYDEHGFPAEGEITLNVADRTIVMAPASGARAAGGVYQIGKPMKIRTEIKPSRITLDGQQVLVIRDDTSYNNFVKLLRYMAMLDRPLSENERPADALPGRNPGADLSDSAKKLSGMSDSTDELLSQISKIQKDMMSNLDDLAKRSPYGKNGGGEIHPENMITPEMKAAGVTDGRSGAENGGMNGGSGSQTGAGGNGAGGSGDAADGSGAAPGSGNAAGGDGAAPGSGNAAGAGNSGAADASAAQEKSPEQLKAEETERRRAAKVEDSESWKKLQALTGLESVKKDVYELSCLMKMQVRRKDENLPEVPFSLHLVFAGNPGTGKTTVARLLAGIYKDIGVLSKGQLVECDRSDLVAGFVGQTAMKTKAKIDEAKGGILFIDEAYTLNRGENDFGQEAIDTILKAMEDMRDDFIVIVAGYTDLMEGFIDSNPGLKSRFSKYITFPDYTADELVKIFDSMCGKYNYVLTDEAHRKAEEKIRDMEAQKGENFANARDVRNFFEKMVTRQASRLAGDPDADIRQIDAADVDPDMKPEETGEAPSGSPEDAAVPEETPSEGCTGTAAPEAGQRKPAPDAEKAGE